MVERVTGWLSSVNARVYPHQNYNHCNITDKGVGLYLTQWHIDNTQYVLVSNEAEEMVVTDKSRFTNIISTVSHNFDINLKIHDISLISPKA